jgi:hypothetical protein
MGKIILPDGQNPIYFEGETEEVSDGYHSYKELYEHRITLYIAFCKLWRERFMEYKTDKSVWMTKVHSDGSVWEGWFILGIGQGLGEQITYHLPNSKWDECIEFAYQLKVAPVYDNHTSQQVLERLKQL